MHINNVSSKTSKKLVITLTILSIIYTAALILAYTHFSIDAEKSVQGFFSWASVTFDTFLKNNPEDPWIAWGVFVILPAALYLGVICTAVERYFALSALASTLNLKSVDFLSDRVKFNFNRPQYDFACWYGEINNLEISLVTTLARNKYGTYIVLNEVKLNFTVLNNKQFSLTNTPLAPLRLIYNIVDCGRKVNKFSYKFEGAGVQEDIKEKIEDYLHKGVKPVLTSVGETKFKWMSVVFFSIGAIFMGMCKDMLNDCIKDNIWFMFLPIGIFIGVSFLFDIILIVDKIKERNYRGYNG